MNPKGDRNTRTSVISKRLERTFDHHVREESWLVKFNDPTCQLPSETEVFRLKGDLVTKNQQI
jgi:hypothetical protein